MTSDAITIAEANKVPFLLKKDIHGNIIAVRLTGKLIVAGDCNIEGTLTKEAGSFLIKHPDPDKQDQLLRHSFVEAPTRGENIYKFQISASSKHETIEIILPDYFRFLNENAYVWTSSYDHFGHSCGKISDDYTKIIVKCETIGVYNVLVVATRKDAKAKSYWDSTQENYEW